MKQKPRSCFQEFALETYRLSRTGKRVAKSRDERTKHWSIYDLQVVPGAPAMSLNLHVSERYFHLLALRGGECPGALRVPKGGGYHVFILREIATTVSIQILQTLLLWVWIGLPVVVFRVVWGGNGHCFSIQSICPSATWLAPASLTWLKIKDLEQVSLALELYYSPVTVASTAMKIPTTSFISKTFFGQGRPTSEKNDVVTWRWRQLWDTSSSMSLMAWMTETPGSTLLLRNMKRSKSI